MVTILAPEHPKGWPKETAPPLTFTLFLSMSNILMLANPTTEKSHADRPTETSGGHRSSGFVGRQRRTIRI